MNTIARLLLERSAFAIVPLLGIVLWNFQPAPAAPQPVDPWAAPPPSTSQQLAAAVDGLGERLGIGTAHAAGGEDTSATFAYQKAKIAGIYAGHSYRQNDTAKALGTDVAGLRRMLRHYGIIEWPEGHKAP